MTIQLFSHQGFDPARRIALKRGAALGASSLLTMFPWLEASAQQAPQRGPDIPKWPGATDVRQIWIRRRETGEQVVARYFDGRRIVESEYLKCCHILRDVKAGVVAHIDIELLDTIFAMQKWLVDWGIDKPAVIHSGFRTARTNNALEGAARNSMHLKGRAVDLSMAGVPADYLGKLASLFKVGGVGFYVDRGFVHADTGAVRYWRSR